MLVVFSQHRPSNRIKEPVDAQACLRTHFKVLDRLRSRVILTLLGGHCSRRVQVTLIPHKEDHCIVDELIALDLEDLLLGTLETFLFKLPKRCLKQGFLTLLERSNATITA